jgi:hypothetical protein
MPVSSNNKPAHIFAKSMFGAITILILGFGILTRGQQQKQEFQRVTGPITSIGRTFPGAFNRHEEKTRYIQVANHPKVFELFIGKDPGDFSPAFENLDKLKSGDVVSVYYDEDQSRAADAAIVNRLAQFIDKGEQPYFMRGSKDTYGGYFAISAGALIGVTLLLLKKKGTIV